MSHPRPILRTHPHQSEGERVGVISVEAWPAQYGGPYLVVGDGEDDQGTAAVVEDDGALQAHSPTAADAAALAFVDGVRRADAWLYQQRDDELVRGVAGVHARGAVLCAPGERPVFSHCAVERLVVWGAGAEGDLPTLDGGWSWTTRSTADHSPRAPLAALQTRMREAEGRLAEQLCDDGWTTVVDGPLNYVRSRDLPVLGFVKTHHRALLAPGDHVRVPGLEAGQRTSLFAERPDVYSCYLRLAAPPAFAGPWAGIVRLQVPAAVGVRAAARAADRATTALPRFNGIAHVDPRAPQNLQPVRALEERLRRLLGDPGLAVRAVREAARAAAGVPA